MKTIQGIGGSKGYSIGTAVVKQVVAVEPPKFTVSDYAAEEARFRKAQDECEAHLKQVQAESAASIGEEAAEIFGAYLIILRDEAFFKKALNRFASEGINMEYLIYDECQKVVSMFAAMDDPYLQERAVDIENVCNEIIRTMLGIKHEFTMDAAIKDMIVVADDLTPAETVKMDKSRLRGFVTEKGGVTSHTVILAKALGIPAIVGVQGALETITDKDKLMLDAFTGTVTINPDEQTTTEFQKLCDQQKAQQEVYLQSAGQPAQTLDGFHVDVLVNSGDTDSIKAFDADKCDGVGLFRTEFLYMDHSDYPDEETQYNAYRHMAEQAQGKEVIIRTLDIGGDKQIAYMNFPKEENPFLGYRAIRLCLDRKEVFHTQLRAILRASAHGNIKIMFPMIVNLGELRAAKQCVEKAKRSLEQEGLAFNPNVPVGIMVETPAAVFISDTLAKEADFFSIGSNDLIQYVTATDRMNERVQHLYDSCNLSVLRAIRMVANSARAASIPWGICGEVGSEDRLVPVWVALGVSELSVVPSQVGRVKHLIRKADKTKLTAQIDAILNMATIEQAKEALDAILAELDQSL